MILLEYEAKKIVNDFDVTIPKSALVSKNTLIPFPFVVKSQVPTGGRGKAGGVKVVHNNSEYKKATKELSSLNIRGFLPKNLLAEEVIDIEHEFYLAIRLNTDTKQIEIVAHLNGGVDVEENKLEEFYTSSVTKTDEVGKVALNISELYNISNKEYALEEIIKNLRKCFVENDALLIEINPLVLTKNGNLIAADCKIELDDAAAFRHPDWDFEYKPANSNFVTLNKDGNVATIANGAGLAMATVDAVASAGLQPANFLDVGGGANEASVLKAFNEIMNYKKVQAIVINIFAGITRCDEVAKAIVAARQQIPELPPLFIRLAGTNIDAASTILDTANIPLSKTLVECIESAKEVAL